MRFADAALEADFRRYHLAEFLPRMRRSVPVALALFLASRWFWRFGIRFYAGASA